MKFSSKQQLAVSNAYTWEQILESVRTIIDSKKTDKEKLDQIEEQLLLIEIENGIRPEANQGNEDAQLKLGNYCYEKHYDAEAVKWFCKAKQKKEEDILFWLGLRCYYGNEGVKRDEVEAVKWFRK